MHIKQFKRFTNEMIHTGIGLILFILILGLVIDPDSVLYRFLNYLIEWFNH